MKAEDLRVGNWYLNDCDDKPIRLSVENIVTAIKDEDWLLPIPLNEDWLVRLGFKKRKNPNNPKKSFYWWDGTVNLIQSDKLYCADIVSTIELKYVHQLQNLYYALTETELEIK